MSFAPPVEILSTTPPEDPHSPDGQPEEQPDDQGGDHGDDQPGDVLPPGASKEDRRKHDWHLEDLARHADSDARQERYDQRNQGGWVYRFYETDADTATYFRRSPDSDAVLRLHAADCASAVENTDHVAWVRGRVAGVVRFYPGKPPVVLALSPPEVYAESHCFEVLEPTGTPLADYEPTDCRWLAMMTIRHALADYKIAKKRLEQAREIFRFARARGATEEQLADFETWLDVAHERAGDCGYFVSACVLVHYGIAVTLGEADEATGWEAVALEVDGETLIVSPPKDEQSYPKLTIIPKDRFDSTSFGL